MNIREHKIREGKTRCDFCEKSGVGPIRELQIATHGGKNPFTGILYWIDTCKGCAEFIQASKLDPTDNGLERLRARRRCLPPPVSPQPGPGNGKGDSIFNVYGPRPETFQCKDCGTKENPLFGHTLAGTPNDDTRCPPCLQKKFRLEKRELRLTPDARAAWPVG